MRLPLGYQRIVGELLGLCCGCVGNHGPDPPAQNAIRERILAAYDEYEEGAAVGES